VVVSKMRITPLQFDTDGRKVAAWAAREGAHAACTEAGGWPEKPMLTYDGDGLSGCVQEVEWEQFGRLMERGRVGLLHGGEMQQPTFIREEGQAIRGLPDHRPVRRPS
jgi:hypothetical protein